jgi:hypothetical protein
MKGGMFPWCSDLWSSSQAIPVEKKRIRKKVNKILCYTCTYTLSPRVMSYKIIRLYGCFIGSYFVHMYLAEITLKIAYKGCLQTTE